MGAISLLTKILPIALQVVPLVEMIIGDQDGDTKRNTAVSLIVPLIRAAEAAVGRDLVDEEAVADAAALVVDGVVGILNEVGVLGQTTTTAALD